MEEFRFHQGWKITYLGVDGDFEDEERRFCFFSFFLFFLDLEWWWPQDSSISRWYSWNVKDHYAKLAEMRTNREDLTLNIRTRSDSKVIASNDWSPSSLDRHSSQTVWWSISLILRSERNPFSSFFKRRFSSFWRSFSRASAFSRRALYVNLTLPASKVCERLSSETRVANSSNVVLTCHYRTNLILQKIQVDWLHTSTSKAFSFKISLMIFFSSWKRDFKSST